MKNIHLIPTDKPSRLLFDKEENRLLPLQGVFWMKHQDLVENQNIYITNSEEIKEGDWACHTCITNDKYQIIRCDVPNNVSIQEHWNKIILTTDGDLINDGVQAIDDEFLKWFVKNPSCESVEIIYTNCANCIKIQGQELSPDCCHNYQYKIIIPKEEPKQETLEEASERIYPTTIDSFTDNGFDLSERERLIFVNGAKWQGERMYSKEDMECAFKSSSLTNVLDVYESFEEFIEGFKKK